MTKHSVMICGALMALAACTGRSGLAPGQLTPADTMAGDDDGPHLPGGRLDDTFGTGGATVTAVGERADTAFDVVVQPNGAIVVVGEAGQSGHSDFGVARFNADGTLDETFDIDGLVATDISSNSGDGAVAVTLQADGRIVVAGGSWTNDGAATVVRYRSDGTLDNTFGTGGIARPTLGGEADGHDVAMQQDQRIVVAGYIQAGSYFDFLLLRFDATGDLDPSFAGGDVRTSFAFDDYGSAVGVQLDGAIVTAGDADGALGLTRHTAAGTPDTSFASDGTQTTPVAGGQMVAHDLVILGDGAIVIVGKVAAGGERDVVAARYDSSGVLDAGFGTNGIVTVGIAGATDVAEAVVVDGSGRLVLAGHMDAGADLQVELIRLEADGALDPTFGDNGVALFDVSSGDDAAYGVAIQPDGAIVVVGQGRGAVNPDFLIMRLLP